MKPLLTTIAATGCLTAVGGLAGAFVHPELGTAFLGVATAGFGIATPSVMALINARRHR